MSSLARLSEAPLSNAAPSCPFHADHVSFYLCCLSLLLAA